MNIGLALPEWLFPKEKKTGAYVLAGLVGCGIILPLIVACVYMWSSKPLGPNGIMQVGLHLARLKDAFSKTTASFDNVQETIAIYVGSKFSVKESQSLVRALPDSGLLNLGLLHCPKSLIPVGANTRDAGVCHGIHRPPHAGRAPACHW